MGAVQLRDLFMIVALALAVLVVGVSVAFAGTEVRDKAKLDIGTSPGPTGEVELELRGDVDDDDIDLDIRAKIEGLDPGRYSLCVTVPSVGVFFIDDDIADDQGRVELDDDVDLPLGSISSLSGVGVKITAGFDPTCAGSGVLMVTV